MPNCNDWENERSTLKDMVDELQDLLDKRKGAVESLESKNDLLEKEKILKETEIKVGCLEGGRG